MNPITANCSVCSISRTPASRIASPPTPVRLNGAFAARSARATPAACKSPETSPATKTMSRTAGERRKRTFDLADDGQRDGERLTSVAAAHGDLGLAPHRLEEILKLEPERFTVRRLECNTLDKSLQRLRPLRLPHQRHQIDIAPQSIELAGPGREIERQIAALLEDAQLAHALTRDPARRDVRNRACLE